MCAHRNCPGSLRSSILSAIVLLLVSMSCPLSSMGALVLPRHCNIPSSKFSLCSQTGLPKVSCRCLEPQANIFRISVKLNSGKALPGQEGSSMLGGRFRMGNFIVGDILGAIMIRIFGSKDFLLRWASKCSFRLAPSKCSQKVVTLEESETKVFTLVLTLVGTCGLQSLRRRYSDSPFGWLHCVFWKRFDMATMRKNREVIQLGSVLDEIETVAQKQGEDIAFSTKLQHTACHVTVEKLRPWTYCRDN